MNRKIKFRAWDKEEKVMIDADSFALTNINDFEPISELFESLQEHFVLMQYTGFMDENGKEIYDGDILVYERNYCIPESCIVFWAKESGWVVDIQGNDYDGVEPLSEFNEDELKIVGNIYENPELMEKK